MTVPTHVEAEGVAWTVERAWPDHDRIALEVTHPDCAHRRAGHLGTSGAVRLSPPGADRRLPALAAESEKGTVVSHRPGRRAVVRSADGDRFTKIVRPGRGPALAVAARAARVLDVHVSLPRVLDSDDERLTLSALPGRSLLALADAPAAHWREAWAAWADAWTGIADVDPWSAPTVHDAAAEVRVLSGWHHKATAVLTADDLARLDVAVGNISTRLRSGRPAPAVLCHRDLHDQQVLWHPRHSIGLLDVDTLAAAEAALDLGNLRAHVTLRRRQGLTTPEQASTALAQVDAVADRLGVDPERLRTYEDATTARLVCVYAFRPRWRDVAMGLLDELS